MGALLSAYKKVHPKDRPRLSDLAEAYRDVFPDDGEGGENEGQGIESLEGEQADKNVPDTTTRARASLADEEGAEATPSKILDRDQVPLNKESALARRPVDQTAVEGRAPRTATARITHRQDAEALVPLVFKRTNVTASAGQRSDKKTELAIAGPSPAAGKMAPSATLPAKAPARPALTAPLTGSTVATSAPDHRAWLMKQMERQQRRFRIEGASRRVGGAETSIKAFADAWRGVRSRGAFARKERKLGETERREGRLRVLAWEL